jgi:death-on-curing protein
MQEEGSSFAEVVAEVSFQFLEEIDFSATDPDALLEIVRRLTIAAFRFNHLAITEFGGRSGQEREPGLVESGVASAFQTFRGKDLYPGPFRKAAAIWRSITQGHPFEDGNKRTGILTTMYYLRMVGYPIPDPFPEDEVFTFSLRLSRSIVRNPRTIAAQLRRWWRASD